MTQIFFYHNVGDRIGAAAALIGKAFMQRKALLIFAPDHEVAGALDRHLWIHPPTGFIPHVRGNSPLAEETPVVIADDIESPPQNEWKHQGGDDVINFNCDGLASLIRKQLAALRSGVAPERIGLPDFAGTPSGRGALHRLAESLENPGKRRFPRRRQHYRAVLCAGLQNLWNLFSLGDAANVETSNWMITNESPDGYSIMHVFGSTLGTSVGDIVALRPESGSKWQVCIIRWADRKSVV